MTIVRKSLTSIINKFRPNLKDYENIYRNIHQHPELGRQEKQTSIKAAEHLKGAGYEVTMHIGGYGLAEVLRNGEGSTILLRAEMDALPIREETGLSYASTAETIDTDGTLKPIMHACGHDMHVAAMMGAATLLARARTDWRGTLIVLFHPDEEHGAGARAMLEDGLYSEDRIPRPDLVLGQHLVPHQAGAILIRPGVFMSSADIFSVQVRGRGGHGAMPQDAIDQVVIAAAIILRLQTIVSRELAPSDVAAVTCASIHGEAHNVIPDTVELIITIRTFEEGVRSKAVAALKRIVKAEAAAAGVEQGPEITLITSFPLIVNGAAMAQNIDAVFAAHFGRDRVLEGSRQMASEDFSLLPSEIGVPYVFWNFGGVDAQTWKEYERTQNKHLLPRPHQAKYAPVMEPTLRTDVDAMSVAALTFLRS